MFHRPNLESTKLEHVKPGSLIAFDFRKQTCFALVIKPIDPADSSPDLICLGPEADGLHNLEVYSHSILTSSSVLVMPEAQIELSTKPLDLHPHFNDFNTPRGAIFLMGQRGVIASGFNGRTVRTFDIQTGDIVQLQMYGQSWVSTWYVTMPDANGLYQTILKVEATTKPSI